MEEITFLEPVLDFAKHADKSEVMKITAIWQSIPVHLSRENKKFIFSVVRQGARGREYEEALQWLVDAGLIYKSYNISAPRLPLKAYMGANLLNLKKEGNTWNYPLYAISLFPLPF